MLWLLIAGLFMGWARARLHWCAVAIAGYALVAGMLQLQANDWRRTVGIPTYDAGTIAVSALLTASIFFGVAYAIGRGMRRWLKP